MAWRVMRGVDKFSVSNQFALFIAHIQNTRVAIIIFASPNFKILFLEQYFYADESESDNLGDTSRYLRMYASRVCRVSVGGE